MALLNSDQRASVSSDMQIEISEEREALDLNKTDLRAAIDATDQWVSDNANSYNNALPTAAKTNLTAAQKSRLLRWVVKKRYEEGV